MTKESLVDALVYADIPSRTVLTSVLQDGLLKKSIFASNAFIYHFDDIRDAIDLVLRGIRDQQADNEDKHNDMNYSRISTLKSSAVKAPHFPTSPLVFHLNHHTTTQNCLKMNELFDSEQVRFACSRASEDLLNSRRDAKTLVSLPSATILISLDFLDSPVEPISFERADILVEKLKSLLIEYGGPILASSNLKRNLQTGRNFKFFAEFYRISDGKQFLETCQRISGPIVSDKNVQVTFEGVHLYDIDREALFFSCCPEEVEVEVETESSEEDQPQVQVQVQSQTQTIFQGRKDSISSLEGTCK